MIQSMTGYGRGELKTDSLEILSEVRSLNNRFLDISVRLPSSLMQYEQEVKSIIKQYQTRGRINVTLSLKNSNNQKSNKLEIDEDLAKAYFQTLTRLASISELETKIELTQMLNLPNVLVYSEEEIPPEEIWESIKKALQSSLEDLSKMRRKEGVELCNDFKYRIELLNKHINNIEALSPNRVQLEYTRLQDRIQQLIPNKEIDPGRLEMEIAILADRLDVTEECIRFRSHSKMFMSTFEDEQAGGRRLNFVTQEMNREANTIGAKANDAEISSIVILIKEELEKIREQVQNIE